MELKRRNFLKFLAGLPALALFPWSGRKAVAAADPADPDALFLCYHERRMFFVSSNQPVTLQWSKQCNPTDWRVFVGSAE